MTAQPVEANVVLTADNSGYDQAMNQSAGTTEQLMSAVDSLTAKVSKMTKVAGKSLIGITAADTGLIIGATKAWNDYEKQMERLRSQAAVLGRNQSEQAKVMKDYTATVKTLRSEMGTTTTEAARLVETLSKVTSVRQTRDLSDMTKTFVEMSKATGESSEGLANSLTNLQQVMGTPINAKTTKQYADTFTYLSAQTNTSAEGLMNFTSQLAPVARSLGMNTKEVAGFATAFTRAGADSGAAATAFTKVTGDMLKSIQTGSPELAHYANMVGTTQGQFKKLAKDDSAEAVVEIFESLARNSKNASTEMSRLGLDGPRTMRQITQMMNAPGGIRAALGLAESPRAAGSVDRGYQATLAGLSDEFDKIQEDLKQTAEAFATYLGPALGVFLKGIEAVTSGVQKLTEGPMGKFMSVVAGFLAPLAGGVGLLLLFAGALVKVASAFTLLRSSAAYGVREGFMGRGSPLVRQGVDAQGRSVFGAMGGGPMGTRGAQLAEGGTWIQRAQYNVGAFAGQGLGAFRRGGAVPESWFATREAVSRNIPWTKDYMRPTEGTMRSPLSYVSGALGKGIEQFVTPTFDQMRYADPTKRTQWAAREAPWATLQQRGDLGRAMGRVGLAESQLAGQRAETTRVHQDPLLSDEARQARLGELRALREETMQRRASARANETTAREVIASEQQKVAANEATTRETTTLGRALRGLGVNAAGGVLGGLRQGAGMAWKSGLAGQGIGMGAMVAGGMTGSNALMMGGTGAMIGSMIGGPGPGTAIGAGIGAGVGLAMDTAKANNSVTESIKALNQQAIDSTKTGGGLVALHDQTVQSSDDLDRFSESIGASGDKMDFWLGAPSLAKAKALPGLTKNAIEGFLGTSDVSEAQQSLDETKAKAKSTEAAFRDLAKAGGTKLTGSATNQRQQIEQFMSTRGAAGLGTADIELEDFVAARAKGGPEYRQMIRAATAPSLADQGLKDRLRTTAAGATMLDSDTAKKSMRLQGDVSLFYDATNEIFTNMRKQGMSYLEIVKSTEQAQQKIGDENDRGYELQMAVSQKAQQALQMQAPQIGRAATFAQQLQLGAAVQGIKPRTEEQATQIEQQKQLTQQAVMDNDAYFRQMLLAQESYERNRQRAQDDYQQQRMYQQQDYDLQRERAEENFNRMRARAVADYHRNVTRAWNDFYLQRRRQEQDYQHQIDVTAQQQAVGMNLYQRRDTQRTSSATWLLSNTSDILRHLREQKRNLNRLRELGFSDAVIQQLQLTDPQNADQLARFVVEVQQDQSLVGRFNRQARQLTGASRALVTDESSLTFQEMQRNFRVSRRRGLDDMNRSMDRQHTDFRRGLRQQREDFNIMMDQQAEDYETQLHRQAAAYKKTMDRSAEDMAHMADEITGSIESVLVRAHKKLTGSAKEQAGIALQSFRDLKTDSSAEAVALMSNLADIFGFKYTAPKGALGAGASGQSMAGHATGGHIPSDPVARDTMHAPANQSTYINPYSTNLYHEGGVAPGYTPGRDIYNISVSGGEGIMRPEWVRAIGGEKAVDAMNHAAKHGAFASGGVFRPIKGVQPSSRGVHDQYTGYAALDFPTSVGTPVYAVGPGRITQSRDIAGPLASDTYHDARYGPYGSYGRVMYLKTDAGPEVLYAHLSKRGFGANAMVSGGQAIGLSGSAGNSSGPHLHFGDSDGNPWEFVTGKAGHGTIDGFVGASAAGMPGLTRHRIVRRALDAYYAKAEASAARMTGVHPLEPGMISKVINRYARRKITQLMRQYSDGPVTGPGADQAPNNPTGNVRLGRSMAASRGWTGGEWNSLYQLWRKESGWNELAKNPSSGAYGIPQSLPGSKMASAGRDYLTNPATQIRWGLNYIQGRYGDPNSAWGHSQQYNWYGNGAMFDQPNVIGVGEHGPEAVIPLNDAGGEFLARSIGLSTLAGGRGSTSIHNYRIDRSTNFTGPITVQANDPNEMLAKLQARQRVRALSRPALTGSAA